VLRPSQLHWLGEHLQAVSEEWLILLIHQPPFISPTQMDAVVFRNYQLQKQAAAALHALLAGHGRVVAVLSGHLHVPKVHVRDGIPYLTAPPLVGPVSALRLFEVDLNPRRGILRYHWVHLPEPGPRPPLAWFPDGETSGSLGRDPPARQRSSIYPATCCSSIKVLKLDRISVD
jgi:Icc protein